MGAKTWKCLMPGCPSRFNDPSEQFRDAAVNTCAGCGRWRYLPHALAAGATVALVAVIAGVGWLVGIPARSYGDRYDAFLRDGKIDEKERQELARLAEKYRLADEVIARIQDEVRQRRGLNASPAQRPTPSPDQPPGSYRSLVALIHNIYSDHLKTADEQRLLAGAVERQRLDQAQGERIEQQVKARWERAQPYFERGLTAARQAKYQAAIEEFQRALAEDADNAWILANLGAAYLQADRIEDAQASCRHALDFDERNWLAHYNLGSYHAKRGEKDAAIESLRQALECVAEDRTQRITRVDVVGQLRADRTLSSIRQDARFLQLLAKY
jgi:tetratricopeptide (TPR) repeat protein